MADAVKKKPKTFTKTIFKPASKEKNAPNKLSPRNPREIPEKTSLQNQIDTPVLVSFLSGIVLLGIIVIGLMYWTDLHTLERVKMERSQREKELVYWEKVVQEHPDYRDGFLEESSIAKSLGYIGLSQEAFEKALAIDPNLK